MKNHIEEIIHLFYIEHQQTKYIAKKIHCSSAYISKIIKQDDRYAIEKDNRKEVSRIKRKNSQNEFIKKKREEIRIQDNYDIVKTQHEQAIRELSKARHLSDESYRKWNQSAYQYNPLKKRYEFDDNLGRSYDIPKYIKER